LNVLQSIRLLLRKHPVVFTFQFNTNAGKPKPEAIIAAMMI
jgi:hypothetical protein